MSDVTHVMVRVPLRIRQRPGRRTVVMPVVRDLRTAVPTQADPALVKAVARAFRYQRLLDEGRYASISEMAAAEKIERGYLGTLLRLTLLMPEIVETILDGRAPTDLTAVRLLQPFSTVWAEQRRDLLNTTNQEH